jgi:hypothetical protein
MYKRMASTSGPLQPAGEKTTCKLLDDPVLDDHVIVPFGKLLTFKIATSLKEGL